MSEQTSFDMIVFGATGFTGGLVCAHMIERSQQLPDFKWAIAGRSQEKLEALRDKLGVADLPIVIADHSDAASIAAMVASANIIISTVGPYKLYGEPLIKACAESGTDYVDLCGEPIWMQEMILKYDAQAKNTGARILFSCGFDSIPSELGVWFCQQQAQREFGKPMPKIRGRVRAFVGEGSGGSIASWAANMASIKKDPSLLDILRDPFALTPGFTGPKHENPQRITVEPDVGQVGPFNLGPTDMKNVHRSNFLMGHPYGKEFMYDELQVGVTEPPSLPDPSAMPAPGEGPDEEALLNGSFDILFIGSDNDGNEVKASVTGARDPGYACTAAMIFETALCLSQMKNVNGGIWTPGSALQGALIEPLQAHAYMSFNIE